MHGEWRKLAVLETLKRLGEREGRGESEGGGGAFTMDTGSLLSQLSHDVEEEL